MNERDQDSLLDRAVDEVRRDSLDDLTLSRTVGRVWSRIASEAEAHEHPLRGCADYRELIPGLVDGSLTGPRALLVADHTRECLACRRTLKEARGDTPTTVTERRPHVAWRVPRFARIAAVAVLALGLGAVVISTVGNLAVEQRLTASLDTHGVGLQLVEDDLSSPLESGAVVRARQRLRTVKDDGATLRLADGTVIEMDSRSELSLHGSLRGTTVRLARGNIIVHAADQRGRRLFVATDDCVVAVKGTIFAVDHGLKGSRVSVIEGSVEVQQAGQHHVLAPGDQVTTNDRLRSVAISQQIAWSRNADQHLALLNELTRLQREVAAAIEPIDTRTSTALLDLAPADTLFYVALPNLTEGIREARQIIDQRVASSELLRQWWQKQVQARGIDREIDNLLDRLQPLGQAVGDEVVIALPTSVLTGDGGPVVLAQLDSPGTFAALLQDEVARVNRTAERPVLALTSDPSQPIEGRPDVVMTIHGDLFAASSHSGELAELLLMWRQPTASSFVGSRLHAELGDAYRRGVAWLVGIDLSSVLDVASAAQSDRERALLEELGVNEATTLVIERHRDSDATAISAELQFSGPRRGVAAWLAEPAPMAGLEFISPDASLATAVVAKDAVQLYDEVIEAITMVDDHALQELDVFQRQLGLDLRADLAATVGGEVVVALDGPVLPTPGWKLVVEVYDFSTLQSAIERVLAAVNHQLAEHGKQRVSLVRETSGGRTYFQIQHPETGAKVVYTVVEGFLVVAPHRSLVEHALQHRSSGVNLPGSGQFRDLLPDDRYTDCSALVYRNLSPLASALPATTIAELPEGAVQAIAEPSLICVYAQPESIVVSGGGGSLLNAVSPFGLSSLLRQIDPLVSRPADVSSRR
jgi:hypothetical protein